MNEFRIYDTHEKRHLDKPYDKQFYLNRLGTLLFQDELGLGRADTDRYKVERLFLDNPTICKTPMYHKDRVLVKLPDGPHEEGRTFEGVIEFDEFDGRFYVDEYRNGKRGWDCHYVHGDMTIEVVGRIKDEGVSLD